MKIFFAACRCSGRGWSHSFARPHSRLGPLLLPALLLLAHCGAGAQPTSPLADLDVAWISLSPRYPAYSVRMVQGAPELFDPAAGKAQTPEEAAAVQRWPRRGETVTATARILNHAAAVTGPFRFTWLLNGKRVASGRHPGLVPSCRATPESHDWNLAGHTYRAASLQPGTYVDLSYSFKWQAREHRRIEIRVEPEAKGETELTLGNNSRTELLDSLSFVVLVRRSSYNAFATLRNADGTYGFEDWAQRYFDLFRGKLESSISPSAQSGTQQSVRIDRVVVLDDGVDTSGFEEIQAQNGWDGHWEYAPARQPAQDAPATEWSILRELGLEIGLAGLGGLEIPASANSALEPSTSQRVELGFSAPGAGMMEHPGDRPFSEADVVALNRMKGWRRGYRGIQLYDLPQSCRLRILDNNGHPAPSVEVAIYQCEKGRIPATPLLTATTGPDGLLPLPNRPAPTVRTAPGLNQHENPFGPIDLSGANGLLFLRLAARGGVDYQWIPITTFNIAAGTGHHGAFDLDVRSGLPSLHAPAPPAALNSQLDQDEDLRTVSLTWAAPSGSKPGSSSAAGYFVYRAFYPYFTWERIGALTRPGYVDLLLQSVPGFQVRYAVTTVDLEGNESAMRSTPVLLVPDL